MEFVVRRCRELYNAALQERHEAWQKCGVSVTVAGQSAQLPAVKEVRPEYRDIHSQVLQDVLTRLDRAFQAFFRRVKRGVRRRAIRASRAAIATTPSPTSSSATGLHSDNGFLVLSKIGRIAVRWSRPLEGTPKTVTISREADGWYVCFSCADVPVQPLAADRAGDGHRLGLGVLRHPAPMARRSTTRGCYRKAERRLKTAQRGVAPQAGEPSPPEGGHTAGESALRR